MRHPLRVFQASGATFNALLSIALVTILVLCNAVAAWGQSSQQKRQDEILAMIKEAMTLLNQDTRDSQIKARDMFRAIIKKPKEDTFDVTLGRANFYSGLISSRLGENDVAVKEYTAALQYLRAARDEEMFALALNNLSLLVADRNQATILLKEAIPLWKKLNDVGQLCNSLINMGAAERDAGRPADALVSSINATTECEKSGDKLRLATAYDQLASLHLNANQFANAIAFYTKGLAVVQEAKAPSLEALIIHNLAETYFRSGDHRRAKEHFEQALSKFRLINDAFGITSSLRGLTANANAMKSYDEAIAFGEDALRVLKQANNFAGKAEILNFLSYAYSEKGNVAKAIDAIREARELFKSQNRPYETAHTYFVEGILLERVGKSRDALKPLRRAYEFFSSVNERAAAADSLQIIGRIRQSQGDIRGALKDLEQVVASYRTLNNRASEHEALMMIVLINLKLGNLDAAALQASETEAFGREANNKDLEAAAVMIKGMIELNRDNLTASLDYVARAEKLLEGASREARVVSHATAGTVYNSLGLTAKAREALELSLKLIPEGTMRSTASQNLILIGLTYANEKKFSTALEYTEKALTLASKMGDASQEATCLNNIGAIYARQKQNKKAIEYYERALRRIENSPSLALKGLTLANLGSAYAESDGDPKAIAYLNQALPIAHRVGSKEVEASILGAYAIYWHKQKNRELAVFYGKQAVNLIQSIRHSMKTLEPEYQQAYIDKFAEGYRMFADVLIEYGQIAEAERVLAMLKEQEYFDFLRRDGGVADELLATMSLTPEEQKIYKEYRKFADELTELGREFGDLEFERNQYEPGKFPKQARYDELEGLLSKANVVFAAFVDQLKVKLGKLDVRVKELESGSQALLKELKEPRTVFVSTIVGADRLNVIVTTADTQKAYSTPIREAEVNKLVAEFRGVLRSPRIDPRGAGKALFDVLFPAGMTKDLEGVKADTIVWSLDGTLRYVPISALWDGEKYLVERFNNVVVTLASRDKINVPRTDRTKWKALGVGVSKEASLKENDGTTRTFEALTSVPEELCTVISDRSEGSPCKTADEVKGAIDGKTYLDESFTLQSFKDSMGRYPVVHIASHFSLNPGNEHDSYLLLGGGSERRLTLASIRQGGTRFVGVDLLTLSACNTGMSAGNTSNGLEIEAFGALAQRSGAKSVLASLWPVADASTRDLMVEFYTNLNSNPSTKAEALRRAQLKLLNGNYQAASDAPAWRKTDVPTSNDGTSARIFPRDSSAPFAHPYYWSPFILIGNWH